MTFDDIVKVFFINKLIGKDTFIRRDKEVRMYLLYSVESDNEVVGIEIFAHGGMDKTNVVYFHRGEKCMYRIVELNRPRYIL